MPKSFTKDPDGTYPFPPGEGPKLQKLRPCHVICKSPALTNKSTNPFQGTKTPSNEAQTRKKETRHRTNPIPKPQQEFPPSKTSPPLSSPRLPSSAWPSASGPGTRETPTITRLHPRTSSPTSTPPSTSSTSCTTPSSPYASSAAPASWVSWNPSASVTA